MTAASAGQMTTWRTPAYWAETFTYVLAPEIVFKARVNAASFTYPATTITFDTVTVGAFTDLLPGMVLNIGSADKLHDRGRLRIVSATSTVLTVPRFSRGVVDGTADLDDNLFLTVYKDWRVAAKIPYIDPSDGSQHKDGSVAYGVNSSRPPKANILFEVDDFVVNSVTSLITVDFTGNTSFPTGDGATIASYAWAFGSTATPTSATTANVTGVTFPAGKHWVSLTVTDSAGVSHTMRQFIPACSAANPPLYKTTIDSHAIHEDGQTVSLTIYDNIAEADYPDGTLLCIWQNEHYGDTQADLSASSGRKKLKFYGWHVANDDELKGTPQGLRTKTKLDFVDVAGRLKVLPGFSLSLEDKKPTPSHWGEIYDGTIELFVHHILQWHSTALDVAPFIWSALDPIYQFSRLGTNGQTLFDMAKEKTEAIAFTLNCDTKGILRMVIDPQLADANEVVVPLQRPTVVRASLTEPDIAELDYDTNVQPPTHWIQSGAVSEGTNTFIPVFSVAPGSVPAQGTSPMSKDNQMIRNPYQANLNIREGHRFARANAQHNRFRLVPTHNGDLFDPGLGEWVRLTIGAAYAAKRGLTFTNAQFLVRQIDVSYDAQQKQIGRVYTLEKETSGTPAETVNVDQSLGETYTVPATSESRIDGQLAAFAGDGKVYVTSNFNQSSPTWVETNLGVIGVVEDFYADPFVSGEGWLVTTGSGTNRVRIYRVEDLFTTPSAALLFTSSNAPTNTPARVHASRAFQNKVVVGWWVNGAGSYVAVSTDGATFTEVQTSAFYNTSPDSAETVGVFWSEKTSGKVYAGAYTVTAGDNAAEGKLYVSLDSGATWGLSTSPTAEFIADVGNNLHIPFADNPTETLVYGRRKVGGSSFQVFRFDGTTQTNVSPLDGASECGFVTSNTPIDSSPLNKNLMVCCVSNPSIDIAVFTTTSGGVGGWQQRTEFIDFSSPAYWSVLVLDNSTVILYGYQSIGISRDFCNTIQTRVGDMPAVFIKGIARAS